MRLASWIGALPPLALLYAAASSAAAPTSLLQAVKAGDDTAPLIHGTLVVEGRFRGGIF